MRGGLEAGRSRLLPSTAGRELAGHSSTEEEGMAASSEDSGSSHWRELKREEEEDSKSSEVVGCSKGRRGV